jgi:hypothetical protein
LTFCTPSSILILHKDLVSAVVQTSDEFLTVTNHDAEIEEWGADRWTEMLDKAGVPVDDTLRDSIERKQCVSEMWTDRRRKLKVKNVMEQLEVQPVLNEMTHFSCIMDPAVEGGGLVWVKTYPEPVRDQCSDGDSD